jgi:mannose-6-phosphate isomerase-like protein (cupin superfamily)
MAPRAHEVNEASILFFRRDLIADGVRVARIGLRKGESSTFHYHTRTRDTFYVMAGRLTIVLRLSTVDVRGAYHAPLRQSPEVVVDTRGGFVHRARVTVGESFIIEPNVIHCATNIDDEPCHFLCIEGVGEYDFVEVSANDSANV